MVNIKYIFLFILKDVGFCGQIISISVEYPKDFLSKIEVIGEFCLLDDVNNKYSIDSIINCKYIEESKLNHSLFKGQISVYFI